MKAQKTPSVHGNILTHMYIKNKEGAAKCIFSGYLSFVPPEKEYIVVKNDEKSCEIEKIKELVYSAVGNYIEITLEGQDSEDKYEIVQIIK